MALQVWHVCLLFERKLRKLTPFALFELCIRTLYIRPTPRLSNLHLLYLFAFFGSLASRLVGFLAKTGSIMNLPPSDSRTEGI